MAMDTTAWRTIQKQLSYELSKHSKKSAVALDDAVSSMPHSIIICIVLLSLTWNHTSVQTIARESVTTERSFHDYLVKTRAFIGDLKVSSSP
jgi:hypothetical protein